MIEHRHRLHAECADRTDQLRRLRFGKRLLPRKLLQTVITEHSPEFQHHMGVLAKSRQTDHFFEKLFVGFGKHAKVNHTGVQAVPAFPFPAGNPRHFCGKIDFHQQRNNSAEQPLFVGTAHRRPLRSDANSIFLSRRTGNGRCHADFKHRSRRLAAGQHHRFCREGLKQKAHGRKIHAPAAVSVEGRTHFKKIFQNSHLAFIIPPPTGRFKEKKPQKWTFPRLTERKVFCTIDPR